MNNEQAPKLRAVETERDRFLRHLAEVKTVMKVKGKNELIGIIAALLVDNYGMKQALEARKPLQNFGQKLKGLFRA